jgi:integrase
VRVGGLCGMQIEHLKLEHLYAKVTEKREKTRKVYFQESTAQALRAWLAVRPDGKGPWVFVGLTARAKGQMDANSVGKMLRRRGKQAGCKGPVNPHAFRHGFAISATMSGCPLGATSKILGHSDPAITIKYYHQFTDDQLQEIHAKYSPITKLESGKDDD